MNLSDQICGLAALRIAIACGLSPRDPEVCAAADAIADGVLALTSDVRIGALSSGRVVVHRDADDPSFSRPFEYVTGRVIGDMGGAFET